MNQSAPHLINEEITPIFVDPHGDPSLNKRIAELSRQFGRNDDVLIIDFSKQPKQSDEVEQR